MAILALFLAMWFPKLNRVILERVLMHKNELNQLSVYIFTNQSVISFGLTHLLRVLAYTLGIFGLFLAMCSKAQPGHTRESIDA